MGTARSVLDVLIIGGGPAGLSAALVLARCERSIAVVDEGKRRNAASRRLGGYLTRDGIDPAELIALGHAELASYGVTILHARAADAAREGDGSFRVDLGEGGPLRSRKLLLATGVRDELPRIPGFAEFYGHGVHHCPYCDGFERRGQHLAAFGDGKAALGLALSLRTWSKKVTACTNGHELSDEDRERAHRNGIAVRGQRVARLAGSGGKLEKICFERGDDLPCDAVFFNTGQAQRSDLPKKLGCGFKDDGGVRTDNRQCTGVPGLYLAGDADKDVQFAIVAAAEGATAAVAINRELQDEERA